MSLQCAGPRIAVGGWGVGVGGGGKGDRGGLGKIVCNVQVTDSTEQ